MAESMMPDDVVLSRVGGTIPGRTVVLTPGEIVVRNGARLRYLGNGLLEPVGPAGEVLAKVFQTDDAGPLGCG